MLTVSQPPWVCPRSWRVCFPCLHCLGSICSAGNCLRLSLGCMLFTGLSCSGSGTQVLIRGADLVGPAFCVFPRFQHPRWPGVWQAWSLWFIASPILAAQFSGCTTGTPSQVDVDHPEFQEVSVSNKACLQFGRWCFSGAAIAPFQLWLPSPACC